MRFLERKHLKMLGKLNDCLQFSFVTVETVGPGLCSSTSVVPTWCVGGKGEPILLTFLTQFALRYIYHMVSQARFQYWAFEEDVLVYG